uniref:Uncharacterized protein n=1 Tax=Arundo donax TaxID=35708 RepID=A0A0A9FG17_ARUDO
MRPSKNQQEIWSTAIRVINLKYQ